MIEKAEQDRAREQYAALAAHYQKLGPASLIAAVMAMQNGGRKHEEEKVPRSKAA